MNTTKINPRVFRICLGGMMSALIFLSRFISIQIPLPGLSTMIHLGDVFCIISSLLLGPLLGGLSSAIGSGVYDLINPLYISHVPFTVVFKFILGFVCGKIAYSHGRKGDSLKLNFVAAIVASITYIILHLLEELIHDYLLLGISFEVAVVDLATSGLVSLINSLLAVVIAVPLSTYLKKKILVWFE